jgi:hypothetical protein
MWTLRNLNQKLNLLLGNAAESEKNRVYICTAAPESLFSVGLGLLEAGEMDYCQF